MHLCEYPKADEAVIDAELEKNMDAVLNVAQLGRACRNTSGIKNRQPLGKIYLSGVDSLPEEFLDVVRAELNVKEVELGAAAEEFIFYIIKPQLKTVGPKYGKLLNGIRAHLKMRRRHRSGEYRQGRRLFV